MMMMSCSARCVFCFAFVVVVVVVVGARTSAVRCLFVSDVFLFPSELVFRGGSESSAAAVRGPSGERENALVCGTAQCGAFSLHNFLRRPPLEPFPDDTAALLIVARVALLSGRPAVRRHFASHDVRQPFALVTHSTHCMPAPTDAVVLLLWRGGHAASAEDRRSENGERASVSSQLAVSDSTSL